MRKNSSDFNFSDFNNQFIYTMAFHLNKNVEPRMGYEIQRILHLGDQEKTGDWYLYQNRTESRVYGYELPPHRWQKYVPMSIFSLEYVRKMINMDDLHFVWAKKKDELKIKTQVGPFLYYSRAIGTEAETLLKYINFQLSFTWSYDPFNIISNLRV